MKTLKDFITESSRIDAEKELALDILRKTLPDVTFEILTADELDCGEIGIRFSRDLTKKDYKLLRKWLDKVTFNKGEWIAFTGGGNVLNDDEIAFETKEGVESYWDPDDYNTDNDEIYDDFDAYWESNKGCLLKLERYGMKETCVA